MIFAIKFGSVGSNQYTTFGNPQNTRHKSLNNARDRKQGTTTNNEENGCNAVSFTPVTRMTKHLHETCSLTILFVCNNKLANFPKTRKLPHLKLFSYK